MKFSLVVRVLTIALIRVEAQNVGVGNIDAGNVGPGNLSGGNIGSNNPIIPVDQIKPSNLTFPTSVPKPRPTQNFDPANPGNMSIIKPIILDAASILSSVINLSLNDVIIKAKALGVKDLAPLLLKLKATDTKPLFEIARNLAHNYINIAESHIEQLKSEDMVKMLTETNVKLCSILKVAELVQKLSPSFSSAAFCLAK